MAEEAAWKFAEENGIDLVVMIPGMVIGPLLQPSLNLSTAVFLDIIKGTSILRLTFALTIHHVDRPLFVIIFQSLFYYIGKEISYSGKVEFPTYEIVDIRDVGYAHILGFENPSANGRYCLAGTTLSFSETQHVLHKLYPSVAASFM